MKNVLISFFVLFFLSIITFLIWYFFFNIYEVKFTAIPEGKNIKSNSELKIKYNGINSFGRKLTFRKISVDYKIIEGKELIEKIDSSYRNQISFFTKSKNGIITIQFDSRYSLNPSIFTFTINN